MTHSENAALYSARSRFPTGPSAVTRVPVAPPQLAVTLRSARQWQWLLLAALALAGCKDEVSHTSTTSPGASSQPTRSAVPLRVWFAGDEASQAIIQRQWQAASERPLELRMLSDDQLLESPKCDSDVVVFPAHRLGDLLARQWLVELPAGLAPASVATANDSSGDVPPDRSTTTAPTASATAGDATAGRLTAADENAATLQPAAWIDQTRYGKSMWGLSLGATTPVVMSNFDWAVPGAEGDDQRSSPDAKDFWQAAIEALSEKTSGQRNDHATTIAGADAGAVCDRFIVVLTSISPRESRFGSLLDPESLKARLGEPEFVEAAEILLRLHQLNSAAQALSGNYQAAWQSLAEPKPSLSIGVPPLPEPEVDKVNSISVALPPMSPGQNTGRGGLSDRTMGWNSGHGLVASLTTQCRQTGLAIEFMRWLASESNRGALSRKVDGVSASSIYAPGSSAWRAQRLGHRIAQQPRLPNQPRLPGSAEYRRALGERLVRMLSGEQEPEAALKAAAAEWDEITASRDHHELRTSYEASLGL